MALETNFGVVFIRLYTITSMPIARFLGQLKREGKRESYELLLEDRFNSEEVKSLRWWNTLSVDSLGRVYDCDFNKMIELSLGGRSLRFIRDFDPVEPVKVVLVLGNHRFGLWLQPVLVAVGFLSE